MNRTRKTSRSDTRRTRPNLVDCFIRPNVEALEQRLLFACDISLNKVTGVITIEGTDQADVSSSTMSANGKKINVMLDCGNGADSDKGSYKTSKVSGILFHGYAGDDTLNVSALETAAVSITANGGAGNDYLLADDGADSLYGGPGDDTLIGNPGNDLIDGGDGNDLIGGSAGHDTLYGGGGNDTVKGSTGADQIFGGDGDDSLDGSFGSDTIHGGTGDDTLLGDVGSDLLLGESGSDALSGGEHLDTLDGGLGDDTLHGLFDGVADVLKGGAGKDKFYYYIDLPSFDAIYEETQQDFMSAWDELLIQYV